MSHLEELEKLKGLLESPSTFETVFGRIPVGVGLAEGQRSLTQSFRRLALPVHPDKIQLYPATLRPRAFELFKRLVGLSKEAQQALSEGRYQEGFESSGSARVVEESPSFTLESKATHYELSAKAINHGDFSTLYGGRSLAGLDVVIKVANSSSNNLWLEREIEVLDWIHRRDKSREVAGFTPEMLDTFLVESGAGKLRAIVFEGLSDAVSVTDLIAGFPKGMNPPDAAWVCRRLLGQACAAAMMGLVHGALVPDHLIVGVVTHDPLYIGWTHSVEGAGTTRISHVIDRFRDYYPPEVFKKQTVDYRTDLYMAGKTMIKLLGGDLMSHQLPELVPEKMAKVVRRCVEQKRERRYQCPKDALDDMSRAAKSLWGKRYRLLTLPI
jgi:hypothetical protein